MELATTELTSLNCYFSSNTDALRVAPVSLDDLAQIVNRQRQVVAEKGSIEARFEPLRDMFRTLEKVRALKGSTGAFSLLLALFCTPPASSLTSHCLTPSP